MRTTVEVQTMSDSDSRVDDLLLLTPEDAAAALSIGRTTMYALLSSGAIRSVAIGRSRRVPVAELHSYVHRLLEPVEE
jgi:excisionase family DNA binding protein